MDTLLTLLRTFAKVKDVGRGRILHSDIVRTGLHHNRFIANSLVNMYGKCGFLLDAQQVFDKLPVPDQVSWTALISSYTEHGSFEQALDCLEQMQTQGLSPDGFTLACSLKACGNLGNVERGQMLCMEIIQKGLEKDAFIGSAMVVFFAKCSLLSEAQRVFNECPVRNMVLWTALISGYADQGYGRDALSYFRQMQLEGLNPDSVTYACSLKACGSVGAIHIGRQIRDVIARDGLQCDHLVGNALVDMFSKCGALAEAHDAFVQISYYDSVSWTSLISGYNDHGYAEEALACLEQMQIEGILPVGATYVCVLKACESLNILEAGRKIYAKLGENFLQDDLMAANSLLDLFAKSGSLREAQRVFDLMPVHDVMSWNVLIGGYAEHGAGESVLLCFEQMQFEGLCHSAATFIGSLRACSTLRWVEKGREMHCLIVKTGLEEEPYLDNTLVDLYGKYGFLIEAHEMLESLPLPDAVSWAALISGYAELGYDEQVLCSFEQMQSEGMRADPVTLVHCLNSCSATGTIEQGRRLHAEIKQLGLERDTFVGNALIDMYSKCSSLNESWEVFMKLGQQDVVSWNAMIKGCGDNHHAYMALKCFNNMLEQNVMPDYITFICLLNACCHASLISEGQDVFKMMIEEYKIEPTVEHYVCMVDLFGRSGFATEAETFIACIQGSPSKEIILALLNACKIYGKVELGLKCFHQLLEANKEDASAYMLMIDTLRNAGKWGDAEHIEKARQRLGIEKKTARAWIEVGKQFYEFEVGKNQDNVMLKSAQRLIFHLKDDGFIPNLDVILRLVCINDEKEASSDQTLNQYSIAHY